MIQLAKVFGHGSCKTLAVGRTKVSQLRAHSLVMEASLNSLMSMITRTTLAIELLMELDRSGENHTAFSEESICLGNFQTKSTHVNPGHEDMLKHWLHDLKS